MSENRELRCGGSGMSGILGFGGILTCCTGCPDCEGTPLEGEMDARTNDPTPTPYEADVTAEPTSRTMRVKPEEPSP